MHQIYPADTRWISNLGWLQSNFSFSFAGYHDPDRIHFWALRVLNDDIIAPHSGFGKHMHEDMEIITIVLSGELTHEDDLGSRGTLVPGDIQTMSAGRGIVHSEFNHGDTPVELFQLWIIPNIQGVSPAYNQAKYTLMPGEWCELVSPQSQPVGVLSIHAEASIFLGEFPANTNIPVLDIPSGFGVFIMVVEGEILSEDTVLGSRDAIEITTQWPGFMTKKPSKLLAIRVPLLYI